MLTCVISSLARLKSDAGGHACMRARSSLLDLSRFESLGTIENAEHLQLYTAVVYHVSLKQRLRVVIVVNRKDPAKPRYIVLATTDTELDGREVMRLYRARFQIEFLFRDAKQFTGLSECQSRDKQALHFHFNAALSTLNLARIEAVKAQDSARAIGLFYGEPQTTRIQ